MVNPERINVAIRGTTVFLCRAADLILHRSDDLVAGLYVKIRGSQEFLILCVVFREAGASDFPLEPTNKGEDSICGRASWMQLNPSAINFSLEATSTTEFNGTSLHGSAHSIVYPFSHFSFGSNKLTRKV